MHLTPRTYLLAALVALLGIIEQWAPPMPFPAWRLAAAVLVGALLYEWLRARRARLGTRPTALEPLALGREEMLELTFVNHGAVPLGILFAPALPPALEASPAPRRLTIEARASAAAAIPVRALTLGRHAWPGVPLRLRGALGLGWWARRCRLDAQLQVVPDLLRVPARTVGSSERGSAARGAAGSGAELHHLREYRAGDPRHIIDWKATARAGKLVTRVYAEDQHLEIVLVLDVGRTAATEVAGLSQLAHFVNATARFVEHAAVMEDRVGVVAVADRLQASTPPQRGLPGVLRIRRMLAELEAQPVETDLVRGALEVQRLVRHRALVIVLTDLYGQDPGGRLAQAVRLLLPRHLPLVVGLVGAELDELAHRPARRWIDPYRSLAAQEYRAQVWRNAAGLRRQGAQTVVTTPAELDAKVLSLYRTLRSQRRV